MNLMNAKSLELLEYAHSIVEGLSEHVVLKPLWNGLTIVLKGSTSRGNADDYSDVDLVIFCEESTRREIVAGYFQKHLTRRQDGIFMFFQNGHYHAESYDQLRGYFLQQDFIHAWDYRNAIALHDPQVVYPGIIQAGLQALFSDPFSLVKRAYLNLQLDLDWMRLPIQRADGPSTLLYFSKLLGGICRMAYLLDNQPYPPDKWLFAFLDSTNFGRQQYEVIHRYYTDCPAVLTLEKNRPFEQNPLYRDAMALVDLVGEAIRVQFGEQEWLGRWYDYV